jgi:5-methylcytosine-specific restriction protein A
MRRVCGISTCPGVAVYRGYCAKHRAKAEGGRPHAFARGYDRTWQARRAAFLAKHPHCVVCGEKATQADHITRRVDIIRAGGTAAQADADSNLQALCASHHSQRTATLHRSGGAR